MRLIPKISGPFFKNKSFNSVDLSLIKPVFANVEKYKKNSSEVLSRTFWPRVRKNCATVLKQAVQDLEGIKNSQMRNTYEVSQKYGHIYVIGHPVMLPSKEEVNRVDEAFLSVMGQDTVITVEENNNIVARFGTGDVVHLPTDKILSGNFYGMSVMGRLAVTTDEHALSGVLAHFRVKTPDGKYFMVRMGVGAYPIYMLRTPVDFANVIAGGKLWQMTDWLLDYRTHGAEKFKQFYGEDALNKLESLNEEKSYNWSLVKQDSFLGMGDGVFLGNPSGSYGYFLKSFVDAGFIPRNLQLARAKYWVNFAQQAKHFF